MAQNLISATLSATEAAEVLQSLTTVKEKLPFLSTLQATEVKYLFKVGNAYLPFLDRIYQVVINHPEVLPAVFNKEEFLHDYELVNTMRPIFNMVNELAEGVQKTFFSATSDAMVSALEVYAAVKINKDKVPGLSVISDEMAEFFKKAKTKSTVSIEATAK
ncbi:MAG: hypothetical protein QM800_15825 [Paludibacter sp.]